ncbi:putative mismatch repair-related protein [Cutaneotrichosporon oleaginosum]|uniref:DNA mismatch repair protein n=1 Tax=Cutaneotrichosporon oleaginosum TaxID=879819 RepID=A0A0J0XHU7_9TREE|nr:putative mismatch repair-related protein [Cutaneotrichosporon oleaginosum]KLT40648.1 putative mismatch repair-related protein [Cutaneotrichosporon oleaginosum]TXT12458.1 hypothetical protein COLE_02868 [Cutaneotrichosporon oleaginosum]
MPSTKQTTLASFFGVPKKGPAPKPSTPALSKPSCAPPPTSSPPSSSLHTPPSDPIDSPSLPKRAKRASIVVAVNDDHLTPPPVMSPKKRAPALAPATPSPEPVTDDAMDVDHQDSPLVSRRRAKRKVVYVESDASSDEDVSKANGRKPRKSLKADDSEDEFVFDADDDAALAAAADEYDAMISDAPSPSIASTYSRSASPVKQPARKKTAVSKSASKKATTSGGSTPASASRAPPLVSRTSSSGGGSSLFLTAAERKKLQAKEDKREAETCFSFLNDIKDKEGNRPEDPEYDPRTIYIPSRAWNEFTPFEKQFWEIKQNHYDTVLFFQKGKFYELYENDAMIGHQEFDLKLTDRVKMKMVGVPEQTFEFWAAKFLAAGYKVGKVEQAETAIGMEMRTKGGGKEIVRRELAQVFTNGTIVDGSYLTSDEANHCVSIKEFTGDANTPSAFGICVMDASTGEFNLTAFEDDICRTRLETMFRQIRPKELVFAKGNLSVPTTRLLRNILPASTLWQSFKLGKEFMSKEDAVEALREIFSSDGSGDPELPEAITAMMDQPLAMEALGGMIFYLRSLNLDKDLISQKNFNIYDPIRNGKSLVLDGQTLAHMEVLMNNEGTEAGTLLSLLQRCLTPFGKRLFRIWLTAPLRDVKAINERLDAVDDLIANPAFTGQFTQLVRGLPDLERLVSRIHAGSIRQTDFLKVVDQFSNIQSAIDLLVGESEKFASSSVRGLLRTAPDLSANIAHLKSMYEVENTTKTITILPTPGADPDCDDAKEAVEEIEQKLELLKQQAMKTLGTRDVSFWSNAQSNKEIFHLLVPASAKVPKNWTKCGGTKKQTRYITPQTQPVIREMQEARETEATAKRNFFRKLLAEFDSDRTAWLSMVRVVAELDCLVSLAKASHDMDEPKCRPEFMETEQAFVDFGDLRHPSMCLQRDFIANNVQLGADVARTTLLTGPNMAGKSTLLRMTAAAVIMAQLGCYVPAAHARLSPIDKIQTRMGAYDNMFASASTFKVELDECSKILREAGPKSLVILDELGRGTSTFDGMAIAGAVLHQLATHTLPLGFFATHYGSLTDEYAYHPNIRNMHMQVHVDDSDGVVFLYKLITGHAESSHGTHVAKLAGVPKSVIARADEVSAQFFRAFQEKLESRRQSALPLPAQADFAWLVKLASDKAEETTATVAQQLDVVCRATTKYEYAA